MPYLGEIKLFAGTFAPKGWAFCDGTLLPISRNSALFALLGTTYGGDGKTNFGLPDLRGRAALQAGNLINNNYNLGEMGGTEKETIMANQLPPHNHNISGTIYQPVQGENPGQLTSPDNTHMAITAGQQVYSTTPQTTGMGTLKTSIQLEPAGKSMAIENMQPYIVLNYVICVEAGYYPPRP